MATPNEISSRITKTLAISEPELDTGVGTPLRKIIDTVAEAIAETTVDSYLTAYQYDIDTRSGADLDAFAAMFGFIRNVAKRASGTILLQRTTPAPESIIVYAGSQAATTGSPPVIVRTVTPAVFPRSTVVLEIPVETIEGGSAGNLAAGAITRWLTQIEGITSITNPAPLVGGSNTETDEQFRDRLKKTIFRNLAGTKDMFMAIALAQKDTSTCEVYTAYERWTERIEIIGGTGSPSIANISTNQASVATNVVLTATNASPSFLTMVTQHSLNVGDYVYISGAVGNTAINGIRKVRYVSGYLGLYLEDLNGNPVNGNGVYTGSSATLRPLGRMASAYPSNYAFGRDIDFNDIFSTTTYSVDFTVFPPLITVLDAVTIPDGIYEFSFLYTSQASRNYPNRTSNIIADRVDVWIDGQTIEQASTVQVLDSLNTMDEQSTLWPSGAWRRRNSARVNPANSASIPLFLPLPLGPIIDVPTTLTIGSTTYTKDLHYFLVDRIEHTLAGSMEARSGLEFDTRATTTGAIGQTMTISATTNATPVVVTVTAAHRLTVGQRIKITGATVAALNKDWYISAVTGTTITLQDSVAPGSTSAVGAVRLFHPVAIDYTFNSAPLEVQRNIETWRLAGSNVLVHKAVDLPLRFFVAVILKPGYTAASVQTNVDAAAAAVLKEAGIGGVVQISDVIAAISQVSGIDAVRMLTGNDMPLKTISAAANQGIVTTSTNHGFVANQMVDISGVTGMTSLNGSWTIASITSPTVFVVNDQTTGVFGGPGVVRSGQFATQIMSVDGTYPAVLVVDRTSSPPRPTDLQANDTERFTLHSVVMTVKAQNSWI